MNVYAISFKEKGLAQVEQVRPHVLLVMAKDEKEAGELGRAKIKELDGDLRTMKWAGTHIPLLLRDGDTYTCYFGNIDEEV